MLLLSISVGKCKDLQRKGRISQVFCLGAIETIRVTENSPAIKILHEKHMMVYEQCLPDPVWKNFFSFFSFVIVVVNFRLYPSTDPWLLPAPFGYCFYFHVFFHDKLIDTRSIFNNSAAPIFVWACTSFYFVVIDYLLSSITRYVLKDDYRLIFNKQ